MSFLSDEAAITMSSITRFSSSSRQTTFCILPISTTHCVTNSSFVFKFYYIFSAGGTQSQISRTRLAEIFKGISWSSNTTAETNTNNVDTDSYFDQHKLVKMKYPQADLDEIVSNANPDLSAAAAPHALKPKTKQEIKAKGIFGKVMRTISCSHIPLVYFRNSSNEKKSFTSYKDEAFQYLGFRVPLLRFWSAPRSLSISYAESSFLSFISSV